MAATDSFSARKQELLRKYLPRNAQDGAATGRSFLDVLPAKPEDMAAPIVADASAALLHSASDSNVLAGATLLRAPAKLVHSPISPPPKQSSPSSIFMSMFSPSLSKRKSMLELGTGPARRQPDQPLSAAPAAASLPRSKSGKPPASGGPESTDDTATALAMAAPTVTAATAHAVPASEHAPNGKGDAVADRHEESGKRQRPRSNSATSSSSSSSSASSSSSSLSKASAVGASTARMSTKTSVSTVQVSMGDIARLKDELEKERKQSALFRSQLTSLRAELSVAKGKLEHQAADGSAVALKSRIRDLEAEIRSMRVQTLASNFDAKTSANCFGDLRSMNHKIQELNAILAARDRDIQKLTDELSLLRRQVLDMEADAANQELEYANHPAVRDLQTVRAQSSSSQVELLEARATVESLRTMQERQRAAATETIERLNVENVNLKASVEPLRIENAHVKEELRQLRSRFLDRSQEQQNGDLLAHELKDLQGRHAFVEEEFQKALSARYAAELSRDESQRLHAALKESYAAKEEEIVRQSRQIHSLSLRLDQAMRDADRMRNNGLSGSDGERLRELSAENATLREQLAKIREDFKIELRGRDRELEGLRQQVSYLQTFEPAAEEVRMLKDLIARMGKFIRGAQQSVRDVLTMFYNAVEAASGKKEEEQQQQQRQQQQQSPGLQGPGQPGREGQQLQQIQLRPMHFGRQWSEDAANLSGSENAQEDIVAQHLLDLADAIEELKDRFSEHYAARAAQECAVS